MQAKTFNPLKMPEKQVKKEEIKAIKKPRKPLECFIETCKNHHINKHGKVGVAEVSLTEFTKKCSERWKTMTEKEKRRFNQMADADKKLCKEEKKKMRDNNAPKKPMTAFLWFCEKARPQIQEERRAKGLEKLGLKEMSKELGKQWAMQTEQVKVKLQEIVEKDKARYAKEMIEYEKIQKENKENAIKLETKEKEENASAPSILMIFDEESDFDLYSELNDNSTEMAD